MFAEMTSAVMFAVMTAPMILGRRTLHRTPDALTANINPPPPPFASGNPPGGGPDAGRAAGPQDPEPEPFYDNVPAWEPEADDDDLDGDQPLPDMCGREMEREGERERRREREADR
jgi:hypothetical protein